MYIFIEAKFLVILLTALRCVLYSSIKFNFISLGSDVIVYLGPYIVG